MMNINLPSGKQLKVAADPTSISYVFPTGSKAREAFYCKASGWMRVTLSDGTTIDKNMRGKSMAQVSNELNNYA